MIKETENKLEKKKRLRRKMMLIFLFEGLLIWISIIDPKNYELMAIVFWKSGVTSEVGPFESVRKLREWEISIHKDDIERKIDGVSSFYKKRSFEE